MSTDVDPALRIAAIDPSLTRTAIAYRAPDDGAEIATLSSSRDGIERCRYLAYEMQQIVRREQIDVVYIEGYAFAAKHSRAHALGELGGLLRDRLIDDGVPYIEVSPSTVKTFATGKGNASKSLVVSSVASRVGRPFNTDDEADAFAIYCLGLAHCGLPHPMGELPKTHLRALDKMPERAA